MNDANGGWLVVWVGLPVQTNMSRPRQSVLASASTALPLTAPAANPMRNRLPVVLSAKKMLPPLRNIPRTRVGLSEPTLPVAVKRAAPMTPLSGVKPR